MTNKNRRTLNITSPNLNEKRLSELYRLMPDLFDGDGQLSEANLRQLFQKDKHGRAEKFGFEWIGKQASKNRAFTPSRGTLIEDKNRSVNFDHTKNLIIEGDNLEVLKLLQTSYFEKVKCIYIDPPYNTGSDFIYPDNFDEDKQSYWQKNGTLKEGVKLVALTETNGRKHSKWLNMMQSRLHAAKYLLCEEGAIIIHIDENEGHRLRMLLDEIFGDTNFIGEIIWDKRNPKGDSGAVSYQHESVLIFAKNLSRFKEHNQLAVPKRNAEIMLKKAAQYFSKVGKKHIPPRVSESLDLLGIEKTDQYEELYTLDHANTDYQKWLTNQGTSISGGEAAYKYIDVKGRVFRLVSMAWPNNQKAPSEYFIPLEHPALGKPCPVPTKGWRNPPKTMKNLLEEDKIVFGDDETTQPRRKYILEENMTENLSSLLYYGSSDEHALKKLGIHFENPKPIEVAKRLMIGFLNDGDIALDFFAGSGTAGHAIMEINAETNKDLRFILIQIPEIIDEKHPAFKAGYKTISDLCIDRLTKACDSLRKGTSMFLDTGFRVYRLVESYFRENHFQYDPSKSKIENGHALRQHLEDGIQTELFREEDLFNIITEISLKNGYGLFYTLDPITNQFDGNNVYRISGNGKDALLCLDSKLNGETVDTFVDHYSEDQIILSLDALNSDYYWILRRSLGENLSTV